MSPDTAQWRPSRRRFIGLGAAGVSLAAAPVLIRDLDAHAGTPNPFTLGVASGDPLPTAVVLWTRLAPEPDRSLGGMPYRDMKVQWEVASDRRFRHVVRRGVATARPEYAHTVHVDARGLRPGRHYFYRFRHRGHLSPVGRTRTAPAPSSMPEKLRLAFVSCQWWTQGFYTAYRHLAQEDVDVVFHLGDYIYEHGIPADGGVRGVSMPDQYRSECNTLDRYRLQHALYKLDSNLQAAHAAFPFIVTWDDHDVANNWVGAEEGETDRLVRQANAYRAYWEHLPLRPRRKPDGPHAKLFRRFTYGRLATFNVLDDRQYRSKLACGGKVTEPPCDEMYDPSRTFLGDKQEKWLLDGMGASRTRWNVIPQQDVFVQNDHDPGPGLKLPVDNWNGYLAARKRLIDGLQQRKVDNLVVLTGDAHYNLAADIKADFNDMSSPTLGSEFVGTSISSAFDGADMDQRGEDILAANPFSHFYNNQRGYATCTITDAQWQTDFHVMPYVTKKDAPISLRKSFVIEAGNPGIKEA